MTGWNLGLTTITSNMAVGKVVEGRWTKCLEEMEREGKQWEEMEQGLVMRGPDSESFSLLQFYFILFYIVMVTLTFLTYLNQP